MHTTNVTFGEWPNVFGDAKRCLADLEFEAKASELRESYLSRGAKAKRRNRWGNGDMEI
jgi:hypothetical protein